MEPIGILDAVHVATFETLSPGPGTLTVLSTDQRIRANAIAMRLPAAP